MANRLPLLVAIACLMSLASGEALACADELDSLSPNALHGVQVRQLAWLAGHWQSGDEESGSQQQLGCPRGGMLLGWQQDLGEGETRFFEFQRYQNSGDGVMLLAQPQGQAPTGFVLIEVAAGHALFENVMHDFPQRIRYQLSGPNDELLTATISGETQGEQRASSWQWTRQGTAPDCNSRDE